MELSHISLIKFYFAWKLSNIIKIYFEVIKFSQKNEVLFVIAVIFVKDVRYKHEISLVKDAEPNQEAEFVRYNQEFVITVIIISEFDCSYQMWSIKN